MRVNVPNGARMPAIDLAGIRPDWAEAAVLPAPTRMGLAPEDQSLLPCELLIGKDALLVQLAQFLQARYV